MELEAVLARLNAQLPLKLRQQGLPTALKSMHHRILMSLVRQGRPPTEDELRQESGLEDIFAGLKELSRLDLVVLDKQSELPLGAYPVTTEPTPHRISVNGHNIFAMCALDAVSVAPMFGADVYIHSSCHVSHTPIALHMQGSEILEPELVQNVVVGIRWQMPTAVAAYSMCLEMVFLKDRPTALTWQAGDEQDVSLFSLSEAVQFGKAFFLPLMMW